MRSYVALLRQRNFLLLTAADAVSVLGDNMGWIALLWLVSTEMGNPSAVGLVGLVYEAPGVFLGAVVGLVLDALPQKSVLLMANALLGSVFTAIVVLQTIHCLSWSWLLTLVFLAGCLTPFTGVGWMVFIPKVVKDEELGAANSLVETVWHGASLVGPLLGGTLITLIGAPLAIFTDGVSFWLAALCVLFLVIQTQGQIHRDPLVTRMRPRALLQDFWAGFQILYRLQSVWWITLAAIVISLGYGQLEISLTLLVQRQFMATGVVLGMLWALYFVSSLLGTIIAGVFLKGRRPGIWMSLMLMGWGVSFLPLLWNASVPMVFVSMGCAGFLLAGLPPLARTEVQSRVPKQHQGRVMGIRFSLIALGAPLGAYVGGALGTVMPFSSVMAYTGMAVFSNGLALLLVRDYRNM